MKNDTVVLERSFRAPVQKVWDALTDPSQMKVWYFPMLEDFKAEVGFQTKFDVPHGDKHYIHIWKVTEVIPGKKISYEWRFGDYPGNSLLTFELFDQGESTRVVLTHDKLDSFRGDLHPDFSVENFQAGWTHFMEKALKEYLEKATSVHA